MKSNQHSRHYQVKRLEIWQTTEKEDSKQASKSGEYHSSPKHLEGSIYITTCLFIYFIFAAHLIAK